MSTSLGSPVQFLPGQIAYGGKSEPWSSKTSESDLQDITEHLRANPAALRALDEHPVLLLGHPMTLGQVAALLSTVKQTPSSTATVKISSDQQSTSLTISGPVTVVLGS